MPLHPLPLADADLHFDPCWLGPGEADALQAALREQIGWETHHIRLFGREVASPRLSCWIGDPGVSYRYSGVRFQPRPWPRELAQLRERLARELERGVLPAPTARDSMPRDFNSVLANLYRDGHDAMGWHSDDEPELGPTPVIASVSLGAARRFVLKHRHQPDQTLALELPHGSLLVMAGATQRNYRHALPRTAKPVGERINLTFRHVAALPGPNQERRLRSNGPR